MSGFNCTKFALEILGQQNLSEARCAEAFGLWKFNVHQKQNRMSQFT
uniref:Uncharacterized protein n=1 Tax=Anguilla anguilla TaxID=7936 RepID=A0A0E9UCB0_ANGAN